MKKVNYRTRTKRKKSEAGSLSDDWTRLAETDTETPSEIRTNIILEEPLVAEAQRITGIHTKSGVVHYALREVVRRARQKELLNLQGKVKWDGDLEGLRGSRF